MWPICKFRVGLGMSLEEHCAFETGQGGHAGTSSADTETLVASSPRSLVSRGTENYCMSYNRLRTGRTVEKLVPGKPEPLSF